MKPKMQKFLSVAIVTCCCALLFANTVSAQSVEWLRLNQEVSSLYKQGDCKRATAVAQRALQLAERELGPDHPVLATSLNKLAELYRDQGRYAAAKPLYARSAGRYEKVLGADHPDVSTVFKNLAALYTKIGKAEEAATLTERAGKIRRLK